MKIATTYNNLSRGKIDKDLSGRFDLSVFQSGSLEFKNFISNFKGNGVYRTGLKLVNDFQDCAFIEFSFSQAQSYLCLFYENKVKFLTFDVSGDLGFVQSGGSDLEVVSPYTLAQAKEVQHDQNADVMKMAHPDIKPQDFKRTSATSFTFTDSITTGALFDSPTSGTVGYPATVLFKDGRLIYGATSLLTTTVWMSEAGDYENFTIPVTIVDDSPIKLSVADLTEPIEWLFSNERSILCGNRENLVVINGGDVNTPLTSSNVAVQITSADASDGSLPIRKDGLIFYVGRDGRNIFYFRYDLLGEAFRSEDANFISYAITKGGISKIKYKKDRDDLVYTIRNDGSLLALNFNEEEKIVGWSEHMTEGEIKDIATITNNEGLTQLFCLVKRGSTYYIEILGKYVEFKDREDFYTNDEDADNEAFSRYTAEQLKECVYLDNSECLNEIQDNLITYDSVAETITATAGVFSSDDVDKYIVYKTSTGYEKGRFKITAYTSTTVVSVEEIIAPTSTTYSDWYLTFSTVSGLSRFEGEDISVVADGGYIGEFTVTSGAIDLSKQVTSACIGYKFSGLIKTFNLGFAVQGENTQKTVKNIYQLGVRFASSAGGLIGTSRYDGRMEAIQELKTGDINYLPPIPLDGTKMISYNDTADINKHLYLEQDKPLPMRILYIIADTKYGVQR